jgi:hypothetical protein
MSAVDHDLSDARPPSDFRLLLTFLGDVKEFTDENLRTVQTKLATLLGKDDEGHAMHWYDMISSKVGFEVEPVIDIPEPAGGKEANPNWTPAPVEPIKKVAVRVVPLKPLDEPQVKKLGDALKSFSSLDATTLLGSGPLLDAFPLTAVSVSKRPTPAKDEFSMELELTPEQARADEAGLAE